MMLEIGIDMAEYCTVLKYGTTIPQQVLNPKDITIVAAPGVKPETTFVLPGKVKGKFGQETSPRCIDHGKLVDIIGHRNGKGFWGCK